MNHDQAPRWVKSTRSSDQGQCVEVAEVGDGRAVRDSKNPAGAVLTIGTAQWRAFTAAVRDGEI